MLKAEAGDFGMEPARIHQHQERVAFGAARIGVAVEGLQKRVFRIARRDQPQGQVVVMTNRFVDLAPAGADVVKRLMHGIIAEHGVEF